MGTYKYYVISFRAFLDPHLLADEVQLILCLYHGYQLSFYLPPPPSCPGHIIKVLSFPLPPPYLIPDP